MKRKITPLFSFRIFLFFLMLMMLPSTGMLAQTISPQKLPFSAICAGGPHPTIPNQIFNEFQAKFIIAGFDSDVTFVVELSDPTGSFTNPVATTALPPLPGTDPDTATNKTLTFAIPTNLVGSDTYRLRVKSSTGIASGSFTIFNSVNEKSFPAYFKAYNGAFFINDKKNSISFCGGGSVTLSVYNPDPSTPNSSPANFPQLKYNWYKDDILIPNQSASSLVVNSPGSYFAKLNYGPCSDDNYRSQGVTVTSAAGGGGATITSSLGNPFCSGSEMTTLTATAGNVYVWRKDGEVIPQATGQTHQTNVPGIYTCDIDFGGCNDTATIDLKTNGSLTADGKDVAEGETLYIEQGDVLTVTATTNDTNPTYQWFRNNQLISSASSLEITDAGNYKVIMSGCTMTFRVSYNTIPVVPRIPNIISLNSVFNTWIIPEEYNNTNTHVTILSSLGEIVFEKDNYVNGDYDNSWPQSSIEFKNFNPVFYYIITPSSGSAKKGSITVLK